MNKNEVLLTVAKVFKRLPFRSFGRSFNAHRHSSISTAIEPLCDQAVREMNDSGVDVRFEEAVNDGPIWVFWWQGLDNAPDLVRYCVNTINTHAGHRRVIVIDKNNIHEYATLPRQIFDLVDSGAITLTHLSDLLRFNLLYNYGGLWMDSTLLCTSSLDAIHTETLFTCSGFYDSTWFNVSRGRWIGFLIGGPAGDPLFRFMDSFFMIYWKTNEELIDYFLIDYALNYAWKHNIGGFHEACIRNEGNQPHLFDLHLNQSLNSYQWQSLIASTIVFKLSYKKVSTSQLNALNQIRELDIKE